MHYSVPCFPENEGGIRIEVGLRTSQVVKQHYRMKMLKDEIISAVASLTIIRQF